jgi:hypothetical protein
MRITHLSDFCCCLSVAYRHELLRKPFGRSSNQGYAFVSSKILASPSASTTRNASPVRFAASDMRHGAAVGTRRKARRRAGAPIWGLGTGSGGSRWPPSAK